MQALHTIFGLGALVGPLISEPFLAEKHQDTNMVDLQTIFSSVKSIYVLMVW